MAMRHVGNQSIAAPRTAVASAHFRVCARFIDKHQSSSVYDRTPESPGRAAVLGVRLLLLPRPAVLCLGVNPGDVSARQMVLRPAETGSCCCNCSNVAFS